MKRKLKNKFNRILSGGGVLLSLCNVSLLGVGFSSWVAGVFVPPIEIQATVGDVIQTNYFSNLTYVPFKLGKDGLEEDYIIVSSSKLQLTFDIDNEQAYKTKDTNGNINFILSFYCSSSSFLTTYIGKETTPTLLKKLSTDTDYVTINEDCSKLSDTDQTIEYAITTSLNVNSGKTNFIFNIPVVDSDDKIGANFYGSVVSRSLFFGFSLEGQIK